MLAFLWLVVVWGLVMGTIHYFRTTRRHDRNCDSGGFGK